MTCPALVAQLALQAFNGDSDAVEVCCDAVIESGWTDERVLKLCGIKSYLGKDRGHAWERGLVADFTNIASRPTDWFVAAVASVAMFEEWYTNLADWPVVARCADRYPQGRSTNFGNAFYGLNRASPEQRLAGHRLTEADFLRAPESDAYEARVGTYLNLITQAPGYNFRLNLDDLDDVDPVSE